MYSIKEITNGVLDTGNRHTLLTCLDLYNSELSLVSSPVLFWNLCVRSEIWISIVIYGLAAVAGQPSGALPPPTPTQLLQWQNTSLFLRGSCQLHKSSISISLPPTPLLVSLLTILTALQNICALLQIDFIWPTNFSLVSGNNRVWCKWDKGSRVFTFNFIKLTILFHKSYFFSWKLSVKFNKFV